MITIELDIFSGLPNPSWTLTEKEERELIDRVIAEPALTAPPETVGGLGYRGLIVTVCGETRERLMKVNLPSLFYINAKKSGDFQKSIVNSLEAEKETTADILQQADDSIRLARESTEEINRAWKEYWASHTDSLTRWNDQPSPESRIGLNREVMSETELKDTQMFGDSAAPEACGPILVDHYQTNLSMWNSFPYLCRNNCYNFGARWRNYYVTCGKAQPGLRTRRTITSLADCSGATLAALYDGLRTQCFTGYQFLVALVIAPNQDYHWYRLCSNGIWCHKPGHSPARNTDDSGALITNPATCNRGIYTTYCGLMYVPYGLPVASARSCGPGSC